MATRRPCLWLSVAVGIGALWATTVLDGWAGLGLAIGWLLVAVSYLIA